MSEMERPSGAAILSSSATSWDGTLAFTARYFVGRFLMDTFAVLGITQKGIRVILGVVKRLFTNLYAAQRPHG